ncbi:MAG: HAMP domain-containing histidine kinase [Lachnospiraceae bacterium]|nr:HAMP domain-containing histidine kinase [Lachnospiraceae bacterium]
MKRSIYTKFIITYVMLALIILTTVATLGSLLVDRELVSLRARHLYDEANGIATNNADTYFSLGGNLEDLFTSLKLTATYEGSRILIIGTDGQIRLDTDLPAPGEEENVIEHFNAAAFGPTYYEVSDFYGLFSENHLNVMIPVTSKMATRGYISVHIPMTAIYASRDRIVNKVFVVAAIFIALSFLILLQFTLSVYRPLMKITAGSLEFARGNLKHRIETKSSDEIGYLAESMNVMAQELDKGNEYQRQFIANVSHDFRSPLTSIKGFTEAMIDGTIPPELHEKYLRIISQEADRLENLTQGIMRLSNMDVDQAVLKKTDFDINRVIKDTAALFEGSCRNKKITIRLVLTGEQLFVNADEDRIKQVLYNLLDNAIKFSDKNSEIKIETEEKYNRCHISVKDHGCGINKNDISRIWNRFYKSDSSRGKDRRGSGLGLAIVKEIINAHGQNINVISTEGVGTEFVFTLELADENIQADAAE